MNQEHSSTEHSAIAESRHIAINPGEILPDFATSQARRQYKDGPKPNNETVITMTDPMMGTTSARGAAIRILSRVERSDSYADKLLDNEIEAGELQGADRGLLTELVYGVLRWQSRLDWVLTGFYHGEFVKCMTVVKNAMRVALYQILFLDKIPSFAAVNESVEIVKRLKGERSAGIVNGVLRNVLNHLSEIRYPKREDDIERYLSVMYSHPQWMVHRWIERFGAESAEGFLRANNERPKVTLRVNTTKISVQNFLDVLRERNVTFQQSNYDERLLTIPNLPGIRKSEAYRRGEFTVQDTSAAMVAKVANPQPGNVVLDLCAAPGGKATFMAEMMNQTGKVIACDVFEPKVQQLRATAERLGLQNMEMHVADARTFRTKELADIVLVDAPCTGMGTLAKKPDIKIKRDYQDFRAMQKIQRTLLANAIHSVKKGGVLVYSTCTTEPEENMDNVLWFLAQFPQFTLDPAEQYIDQTLCQDGTMQTFPHEHHTDGAFAARFVRQK